MTGSDRSDQQQKIVTPADWLAARKSLLEKEKAFTRDRDALTAARRALRWEKVEKDYAFQTPDGRRGLKDVFDGRSQLIVVHFMMGPDWDEGCVSCSLMADHYNPAVPHLNARDVTLIAVSRAPLERIAGFKARMGWTFPWYSSEGSDFNFDFKVSFDQEEIDSGKVDYNYKRQSFSSTEAPGISVFAKDAKGQVCHTYSTFGRGLDMFIGAYHFLDIVPKGRDEAGFDYSMAWVRHHDRYDT